MPVSQGWDDELFESWGQRKLRRAAERAAAAARLRLLTDDGGVSDEDFLGWLADEGLEEARTEGQTWALRRQREWIARRLRELRGVQP